MRLSPRRAAASGWLALAVVAAAAITAAGAGEMAFKFNKRIYPLASPWPRGSNLVALPWSNPYSDAEDLCRVFGLSPGHGRVWQIDPATGATRSHTCGDYGAFSLIPRVGLTVTNPVMTNGVLVGSFPELPAPGYHLYALGPPYIGWNSYPLPYHATAKYLSDLCADLGWTGGQRITLRRVDAGTGQIQVHTCGDASLGALLRLGEAIQILTDTPIDFVPPHL